MKYSKYFIPTQRNSPQEALLNSHKLMLRAGLIHKVSSGLYGYLPYGLLALRNVEAIIRQQMNKAGAIETIMPLLVPAELLQRSGREKVFKRELFRFLDRNDAGLALSATNEETFTQLIEKQISSYKQLPVNLYQIATKFRDEIRPRYGVMRSKEFIMKDAYSFHVDAESLHETYMAMRQAYINIFTRLGLDFVHVAASSGAMGGQDSEEFIVKSPVGEETLVLCSACSYKANLEKAIQQISPPKATTSSLAKLEKVHTPHQDTISKVAAFLHSHSTRSIKTLVYEYEKTADSNVWLPLILILRGDFKLNETKLEALLASNIRLASPESLEAVFHCPKGYLSPINLEKPPRVIADISLKNLSQACAGANEKDYHFIGVDMQRDIALPLGDLFSFHDISLVQENAACSNCSEKLLQVKGIEVGHIFKLGKKYSRAFQLSVQNQQGKKITPTMGCYGIGVNRSLAAIIESNNDQHGIIFPPQIAPFKTALISIGTQPEILQQSSALYDRLGQENISCLWDDRLESPGVKFKDIDLIGIPLSLIISSRLLATQQCELKIRRTGERLTLPLNNISALLAKLHAMLS